MSFQNNPKFVSKRNSRKRYAANQQVGSAKKARKDAQGQIPPMIASAPLLTALRPVNNMANQLVQQPHRAPKKRSIRPPPKPKQTFDNLPVHIRTALTECKDAYEKVIADYEDDHKAVGVDKTGKVSMDMDVDSVNVKYRHGEDYTHSEYDDLLDNVQAVAAMGIKLGAMFWKKIPTLMCSTRSANAYRNRFKQLASGDSKGGYSNSEFAALQQQLVEYKSETNCVSSLALCLCFC